MIFERSKLTKNQILNNENRERIHTYICENPGVYFYHIAKTLNLSNYILGWHIKMLLKFNYIRSKEIDKHEVFFDINLGDSYDELYYFISKEKSRIIISFLIKNPEGITKTRISRELKIHPNTTKKYIESLEVLNILLKKKETKKTLYFLNEPFYFSIFKN